MFAQLAAVLIEQERVDDAEVFLRRAWMMPVPHTVATSLIILAEVFRAQDRHDDAALANKRALAVMEKSLASVRPAVARTLENYTSILRSGGKVAEADEIESRARAIQKKSRCHSREGIAGRRDRK